jgi:hypothetical protein
MTSTHVLADLEQKLAGGGTFTAADGLRVFECPDLVSVGLLGERARRARTGERVTFSRVAAVSAVLPDVVGEAGEVRLIGPPASGADARARVQSAVAWAGGVPVTGFALADLAALGGGSADALSRLAAELVADGLTALAEVQIDRSSSEYELIAWVRAVTEAGLGAWRATVERGAPGDRLALIERARALQEATHALRAFAPLPRIDDPVAPSTGYDDAKTVAIARLRCADIEYVQVDWPLYGPKLAQVAITFGANDIDGVAPVDTVNLGPRKAPLEDIRRQIIAAGGTPVERDARYAVVSGST